MRVRSLVARRTASIARRSQPTRRRSADIRNPRQQCRQRACIRPHPGVVPSTQGVVPSTQGVVPSTRGARAAQNPLLLFAPCRRRTNTLTPAPLRAQRYFHRELRVASNACAAPSFCPDRSLADRLDLLLSAHFKVLTSALQLSEDLHAGGSFVPYRGMPGYADCARRYQTLQQTNGTTYMDEDGEDGRRQQRYRNKLEGRVAAEARIAARYEAEEEIKKEQQQRSIRRKARMIEKYEESIKREEASRTRVMRKKALVHDGERLYRDGECIAGRKGTGALGRQTVFQFTKWSTADPCSSKLDDGYIKHVAGNRVAKNRGGLGGGGGVGGGGAVQIKFQVK